mgnify:CR=1 FL=1|jgi:uncharacterized delta-60 repeat protein
MLFAVSSYCRVLVFCRKRLFAAVCALVSIILCGAVTAAPGQLDPTFGSDGKVRVETGTGNTGFYKTVRLPNGSNVAVGACSNGAETRFCAAKFSSNGEIDLSFGSSGIATVSLSSQNHAAGAMIVDSLGRITLGGSCVNSGFCMARFLADGSLDTSFNNGGSVVTNLGGQLTHLLLVPMDGVIAVGQCRTAATTTKFCLVKYQSNGAIDVSFGTDGVVQTELVAAVGSGGTFAEAATVQPDGKLIVGGYCYSGLSPPTTCVARYNANGSLDPTFNGSGSLIVNLGAVASMPAISSSGVRDLAVQTDGSILMAVACQDGVQADVCVAKLHENGGLDTSFGAKGASIFFDASGSEHANGIYFETSGRIVLSSQCVGASRIFFDVCLIRLNANGSLDSTFGENSKVRIDFALGLDFLGLGNPADDGKVLLAGRCNDETNSQSFGCLIRLKGGPYNPLSCVLNTDANNTVDPATDGLLLTRYLLGFRGDALTIGALGLNPTRTGQALETYLASLNLDADGDGQALAMTDGLLMLRAMLGLTGGALTQGATNAAHPNVRDAQQILTWIESTHGVACLP